MSRKFSLEHKLPLCSHLTAVGNDNSTVYINIQNYVNVAVKTDEGSKSNPTHHQQHTFLNFISTSGDDDSTWNCDEINDPRINYYDLDLRKKKGKAQQQLLPNSKVFKFFTSSHKHCLWKRRSQSPTTADYFHKRHAIIYADLTIHHGSIDRVDHTPKKKFESDYYDVSYLEIDFQKTRALEEADKKFQQSKCQHKSTNSKIQCVMSLCRIFSRKMSGAKK